MKRSFKDVIGFTIGATDGEVGTVKNFLFEDSSWTIRYLVIETGSWLFGRKVLMAPQSIIGANWDEKILPVNLTIEQVKNSPDIDTEQPVSRQEEEKLYEHYPWTSYWGGGLWAGGIGTTGMMMPQHISVEEGLKQENSDEQQQPQQSSQGSNLRSAHTVTGYTLRATDDSFGEVEDFIFDDQSWKIEYLVVDTGSWLPGKKVIIAPNLVKEIQWETSSIHIDSTVDNVRNSPEYDHDKLLSSEYEQSLSNHYSSGRSLNPDTSFPILDPKEPGQ